MGTDGLPARSSWPRWEDRAWGVRLRPAGGWRSEPAWPGAFGVIRCLIAEACRCWAVIMIYSQAALRVCLLASPVALIPE